MTNQQNTSLNLVAKPFLEYPHPSLGDVLMCLALTGTRSNFLFCSLAKSLTFRVEWRPFWATIWSFFVSVRQRVVGWGDFYTAACDCYSLLRQRSLLCEASKKSRQTFGNSISTKEMKLLAPGLALTLDRVGWKQRIELPQHGKGLLHIFL